MRLLVLVQKRIDPHFPQPLWYEVAPSKGRDRTYGSSATYTSYLCLALKTFTLSGHTRPNCLRSSYVRTVHSFTRELLTCHPNAAGEFSELPTSLARTGRPCVWPAIPGSWRLPLETGHAPKHSSRNARQMSRSQLFPKRTAATKNYCSERISRLSIFRYQRAFVAS